MRNVQPSMASQVVTKEPICQCRRCKRCRLNPWVRKILWKRAYPLQYSCLENPMDRGAWQVTVHRVTKSGTQQKQLCMHTRISVHKNSLLLLRVQFLLDIVLNTFHGLQYLIPMDCSPPGSSVYGILQARILEWVAIPSPRDLPDPGLNPGLLHCRQILYHQNHQGSPIPLLKWE